jgi:hypothetical protein
MKTETPPKDDQQAQAVSGQSSATEVAEYRKFVERLAASESAEMFSNGQAAHAAVIFEMFFKNAQQGVNILCRNLKADVFGLDVVINAVKNALWRKVPVRILVQEAPEASNFLALAKQWKGAGKEIEIRSAEGTILAEADQNFAVMDRKAFRFEPNRDAQIAYASMNQSRNATVLDNVFVEAAFSPSIGRSLI